MIRQLCYSRPAYRWESALPVGNGMTAVMVYGGRHRERLAFNDATLWSGYPRTYDNPESLKNLDRVRALILAGRYREAERLAEETLAGGYSESFLPLGDLMITLSGGLGSYHRTLDLERAVLQIDSGRLKRECFASYPAQIVAYQIDSTDGTPFCAALCAASPLRGTTTVGEDLLLCGNAPDHVVPNYIHGERHPVVYAPRGKGMAFALFVRPLTDGVVRTRGKRLLIENATRLTLLCATATGFQGYDRMPVTDWTPVAERAKARVLRAGTDYRALKQAHEADYRALFGRQDFTLHIPPRGGTDCLRRSPAASQALCELLYHYGKYLMIAGSRAGGQPLNLQGQWNHKVRPPWSSNYTVNINTQMNYWMADACGLQACLEPFLRMVCEVAARGEKTARVNYGCTGFACNHNVDLWRKTAPVRGNSAYMYAPLCGAWLANEAYAHVCNGGLAPFREKVEAVVRKAAAFLLDYLVEDGGSLVLCPSASPEAGFGHGGRCALGCHSAFENGVARQALENARNVESDEAQRARIKAALSRLRPFEWDEDGLCEWSGGLSCAEEGHRHFSPLYALYPGRVVLPGRDRELIAQMRKLFDRRLKNRKGRVGWSAAWAICLAARFHDGACAQENIRRLTGRALLPNLFNAHFPSVFQIDGNFGYVAGVNACLIQDEDGAVELLPALPPLWTQGEMRGVSVRGASICFAWKNGRVISVESDRETTVWARHLADNCRIGENIRLKEGEA